MKALLFSMPDVVPMFHPSGWRPPNLGIASLAANAPGHEVVCADLIVRREHVADAVREALAQTAPDLVGLGAMSFQYDTALRVAAIVQETRPDVPIVLGGYHATLLHEEVTRAGDASRLLDYVVRGEGETPFRMLLDTLDGGGAPDAVPGLSWQRDGTWTHNARGPLEDLSRLAIPDRSARLWPGGYHMRGVQRGNPLRVFFATLRAQPLDVVETSRGCTMPCNFCSMRRMYGRTFRTYAIDRVLADIADSKAHGAEWIIFADDNITLDVPRFEALCDAIAAAGHNDVSYIVQVSSAGIASSERLARKMNRANVRIAFLGIENVSRRNLRHLRKGDVLEKTKTAIRYLHQHHILIVAGIILGNPEDTEADIVENYDFCIDHGIEFFGDQVAQPYPGTELREELLRRGLVTHPDDYARYNGFWANVRSEHLSSEDLEFLKWRQHRRAAVGHAITPTLRSAYPVFSLALQLIYYPYRRLRFLLRNWRRTEREIFEAEMRACRKMNDFFADGGD